MTQDEYIDLLIECHDAKRTLDEAIVASKSVEEIRPMYQRYQALLVQKNEAVVDGRKIV